MKRLLKLLQSMILLGISMYLANLWVTQKLAYYINQRYFLLVITSVFLITLSSSAVFASVLSENKFQKDKHQKWMIIYFFPVMVILMDLPVVFGVILFALVFILGITRVSVTPEHEGEDSIKQNRNLVSGLLIFSIPLLIGLFTPQTPLSSETITTRGMTYRLTNTNILTHEQTAQLEENAEIALDWLDLLTSPNLQQFEGDEVHLTGFVYHELDQDPDEFMLGRYVVTCCVADAFAVGVSVEWPQSILLQENQWVELHGTIIDYDESGLKPISIHANSITEIEPLQQPYIYP